MPPSSGTAPDGGLGGLLAAAGVVGPVLVVADDATIAARAPEWAAALVARDIVHRVVVAGVDVAAAAAGLGARVVVAAGSADARAAAREAAAALGVPVVEVAVAAAYTPAVRSAP